MFISDFATDWKTFMISVLSSHGYSVDSDLGTMDLAILYFNAAHRRIPELPRLVVKSDVFICSPENEPGLKSLEEKIQRGEDLTPHLSRGVKEIDGNDPLLSDWGVYHLHLGIAIESDGYVARTGPVLFSLPTATHLYMIQVYSHGNWSNREVMEIIHRNWPELISSSSLKGIDISTNFDSWEIADLRKGHINTSLKMNDGTIYLPPGGGMMTDGSPANVIITAQRCMRDITRWDSYIQSDPPEILEELKKLGHKETSEVSFKLQLEKTGVYALAEKWHFRAKVA